METSTSRSSERWARAAALLAGVALLGAPAISAADDTVTNAQQAPRPGTPSVGVPFTALAIQAGKDEQRLTGALSYTTEKVTFDLKASGANVAKKTQQSLLFDALGSAPGGQLSLGITWSNFRPRRQIQAVVESLCAEQNKANQYGDEKDEEKAIQHAIDGDAGYKRAVAVKAALEAELSNIGDVAAAQKAAAQAWSTFDAAQKAANAAQGQASALPAKADAGAVRAAFEKAREASAEATRLLALAVRAGERAGRAARLPAEIARAKDDVAKEKARVEKGLEPYCYARSQLTPARRARIEMPNDPTFVAMVRGTLEARSTDYFDTADAKTKTDMVYPLSLAVAAGVYPHPSTLLAVRLDYGRSRQAQDPTSVCQNLSIDGKTTDPATYNCTSMVVGAPTWATRTTLRGEIRYVMSAGVGFNPAITYAWSGPESGLFAAKKGSWSIDLPVYMRIKASDLGAAPAAKNAAPAAKNADSQEPSNLAFGVLLSHRQTWGLGDKNEATDDISVFLGGSFDLKL